MYLSTSKVIDIEITIIMNIRIAIWKMHIRVYLGQGFLTWGPWTTRGPWVRARPFEIRKY